MVQDIIQEEGNIEKWLLGTWKTSNGKYIRFYEKENDDATWTDHTLPWVAKPAGTAYWNIVDLEYMWTDEDLNKLANVYRFKLLTPDSMEVYCYEDNKTYTVTREK